MLAAGRLPIKTLNESTAAETRLGMHCHAYGTIIQTNVSCPGLIPAPPCTGALSLQLNRVDVLPPAEYPVESTSLQGRTIQMSGDFPDLFMRIDDLLVVSFERQLRRIRCYATHVVGDVLIHYWILRHVIPMARFLWREAEVLHAGAVEIDSGTAAFLAPCGGGKSTLVRQLIDLGHKLIADDHLLLQGDESGSVIVFPSIPYYRDNRDYEYLGRETRLYDPAPSKLGALYLLNWVGADDDVGVFSLSPAQAAIELLRQAVYNLRNFGYRVPKQTATQKLAFLANVSQAVPVRRLEVPRSLNRLAEVAAFVKSDFAQVVSHA